MLTRSWFLIVLSILLTACKTVPTPTLPTTILLDAAHSNSSRVACGGTSMLFSSSCDGQTCPNGGCCHPGYHCFQNGTACCAD